ncbi:MAG: thiolase family protein [Thermoleophilia bacterium]|nr:thiolase family protein [Thermoleophilia bacterium]
MRQAVIVAARRTPVGAFGKSLRDLPAPELGRIVLEALMAGSGVEPSTVEEVIFGHGYVHGGGLNSARISSQRAGFPLDTPAYVVIKACGSSLKAVTLAAQAIMTGQAEVVVAGGVENMTRTPHLVRDHRWGARLGDTAVEDALLADGLTCSLTGVHMGVTAENLARRYGITRREQDLFALESHRRAHAAQEAGRFADELVPLVVRDRAETRLFAADESVRPEASLENLAKLPAVFEDGDTVTAGNSCPMNDGASAVLMMSEAKAAEMGLEPLGSVRAFAAAGVDPTVMGLGPVPATRKALDRARLTLDDIDLVELNEAFAAQSLAVIRELNLDPARVNVNGGAIALGHPVGATGTKLTGTLLHEMKRRGSRYGLVTLCMAGGQGLTVIYEGRVAGRPRG